MTLSQEAESALTTFLAPLKEPTTLRTLAHAWQSGGGHLAIGTVAVRLQFGPPETAHTAGTLHAPKDGPPHLELARALLLRHGLAGADWRHWCDEISDLDAGFDPEAKFPTLDLSDLPAPGLARLVTGLRDLARMVTR